MPFDSDICNKIGVDFVKTSTGFGYTKNKDGSYSYEGATAHDLKLMKEHVSGKVQIKASGGVRTLEKAIQFKELGVTRIGTSATESIIKELDE